MQDDWDVILELYLLFWGENVSDDIFAGYKNCGHNTGNYDWKK